jgi:hypothetical protein
LHQRCTENITRCFTNHYCNMNGFRHTNLQREFFMGFFMNLTPP